MNESDIDYDSLVASWPLHHWRATNRPTGTFEADTLISIRAESMWVTGYPLSISSSCEGCVRRWQLMWRSLWIRIHQTQHQLSVGGGMQQQQRFFLPFFWWAESQTGTGFCCDRSWHWSEEHTLAGDQCVNYWFCALILSLMFWFCFLIISVENCWYTWYGVWMSEKHQKGYPKLLNIWL